MFLSGALLPPPPPPLLSSCNSFVSSHALPDGALPTATKAACTNAARWHPLGSDPRMRETANVGA
jgi:hypothetical protein